MDKRLAAGLVAAVLVQAGTLVAQGGPPFDFNAKTPHQISFSVDVGPARDALVLLSAGKEPSAALKRLRAHPAIPLAAARAGSSVENYFGRLVTAAAGTPDPLYQSYGEQAELFGSVLNALESGVELASLEGNRIASLLPAGTPISAKFVVVPLIGIAGFADVTTSKDGETFFIIADLPRLVGDLKAAPPPKEVVLKVLRAAASDAWRLLFDANVRKAPAWPADGAPTVETLLSRTVAEGPTTVFLIPDEFFPIDSLLSEPIERAFKRWGRAFEELTDPKKKEDARQQVLDAQMRGDFWNRSAAIVGAEMTDALVRHAGRDAYLKALEKGPRAVATLYLDIQGVKKLPALPKSLRKTIEKPAPAS